MATMLPRIRESFHGPISERLAYQELDTLPPEYIVFHSVNWVSKRLRRNFTFYENDFVILHKKYGILFLEVKGGECFFKDNLMHQVNTVTKEDKVLEEGNDPLSQANRGIHYYRKLIEDTLGKSVKISVEPLIWFPSCDFDRSQAMPAAYKEISFAILDSSAFSGISSIPFEQRLRKVYTNYDAIPVTQLTDEQMRTIRDIIAPDFALVPSPAYAKLELDDAFLRLTNEQSVLLDYIEEQNFAAIQGAAGTGKTLIATMAAERFAKQNRRVLFLCYNRYLYEHLVENQELLNVDYFNIDRFVTQFCHAEAGTVALRLAAYNTIDYVDGFPYDDIIIDKAQDFGNREIQFFKDLCSLHDGHFYAFFDKNQIVHRDDSIRHFVVDSDGVTDIDPIAQEPLTWIRDAECRLILSVNCRNTVEIARSAYSIIDYNLKKRDNKHEIKGDRPSIVFSENDPIGAVSSVLKHYLHSGYRPEDITVLSMKGQSSSLLDQKSELNDIYLSPDRKPGYVRSTTARKFKGLENKVIVITDIDEECFADPERKNVFYVACTRARQGLTMVVHADSEKLNVIAGHIQDVASSMSVKGKIIAKTKTVLFKEP